MDFTMNLIILALAVIAAFIVNLVLKPQKSKAIIGTAFFLSIIGGIFTYGYGYLQITDNVLEAVFRCAYSIIRIFLGEDAVGDMYEIPGLSHTFFIIIWLAHLLGLFTTAGAAIMAFGEGLMRRLRARFNRKKPLAIIYGVTSETLSFGRELTDANTTVIFVDQNADSISGEVIEDMGGLLYTDADALQGNIRFLKNLGLTASQKSVRLYALETDTVKNQQYAENILYALQSLEVNSSRTALTIHSPETEITNFLQVSPEHYGYGNVITVDDADMAARLLTKQFPPCNHISFDQTGKATEDFECLIVGFGRVGQAVLKQLVRNGQFEGSNFKATIFAPNYEQMMGELWYECNQMITNYDIVFFSQDARSMKMFDYLEKHASTLKYVAVCTGDELLNNEIAEQLRHFLARHDSPAKIYICSKKYICHKKDINSVDVYDIYTSSVLCSDQLDLMAMALNQCYCSKNGLSMEENWFRCDYFSRMSSRASADFADAFIKASGMTKEQILSPDWKPDAVLLENLGKTEHLRWCAFHYTMGFRPMTEAEYESRCTAYRKEIAENGSSNIRIGKDLTKRIHACLIDWDALDELSARENAVTGNDTDYKQMDIDNVLLLPELLKLTEGAL